MISIKRATVSEARTISLLGKKTFTETFADLFGEEVLTNYLEGTFSSGKLESSLLKDRNIYGILYYLDDPVGYYKVKIGMYFDHSLNDKYVQLQKIYILHDYLHLKLGKKMLENILSLKEIRDCKMIWLVVLNTNYRAIKFYENNGFEKLKKTWYTIGPQKLEYELMTKSIQV
jgi:diamine N-acetyltransferase